MNDDILRRIKRCMALSQSSNENEAAIALKQARKLMQEHGITEQHVLAAEITEGSVKTNVKKHIASWVLVLHRTVAEAMDCKPLISEGDEYGPAELIFLGEKLSVEVAEYAFSVLHRQLVKARKEFIKTDLKRVKKQTNKTFRADAYCLAWAYAVHEKCKNISPNKEIEEKIKAYTETKYEGKLETYKSNRDKTPNFKDSKVCAAYMSGQRDAADVNLFTAASHSPVNMLGQ